MISQEPVQIGGPMGRVSKAPRLQGEPAAQQQSPDRVVGLVPQRPRPDQVPARPVDGVPVKVPKNPSWPVLGLLLL